MLALSSVSVLAALDAEAKAIAALQSAGLSQPCIDGLTALSKKFVTQFPSVSKNKEASDKFIEDFRAECNMYLSQMSPIDRQIYDDYRKRNGIYSDDE